MSEPARITPPSPPAARGKLYRAAIVGAGSLKGKEVAEVLNERNFPAADIRLLDDDESMGQLEAMGDEISFIQRVRAEQFEHVDFTFFASDPESTLRSWKDARDAGSTIVDLSAVLEDQPGATVRSLWIERERAQVVKPELQPGPCVTAHPVAITLALLLLRANKAAVIKRAIATALEPASEHGQRGMDELHQQTVNLLSFQPLPKDVFDAQVAFNMIARYGPKSQPALDSVESRILRHFRKIVGGQAVEPSLFLLQAPIFHGHAIALFLEFDQAADVVETARVLAGDHTVVSAGEDDWPTNVGSAGQNEIHVTFKSDPVHPNGMWLWAAADNLRISALTAVECAESMTATRPMGKIQ
ncbi:MAG TPA: Asd/ArgC dimerization domain-containing protein [Candidatus Sulfotelmatobacter sp.]|nr:Asd/ArgC dimerization domain-containing protein [Candidatus Sulfotelmatobacter sp.]